MPVRKSWLLCLSLLIFLLSSCGLGDSSEAYDIVGRWESYTNDDHTQGIVYEFHADGETQAYEFNSPLEYLYPVEYDQRRYIYSTRDGTLSFTGRYMETEEQRAIDVAQDLNRVSFTSEDELILTPLGETEGLVLQRVPSPEVPFDVRAVIGEYLLHADLTLVSVERVEGNWSDAFPVFVETDRARFKEFISPEQWVATLQVAGEEGYRLLVIGETRDHWGWILLEKEK